MLEFLENNELQALPMVLQFAILQQLSFASSRTQQECIIHIIRHAYFFSGLTDLEKDPYSNSVTDKNPGDVRGVSSASCLKSPLASSNFVTNVALSNDIFGETSLMSMLEDDGCMGFDDFNSEDIISHVSTKECVLSPEEQERIAALTYECFLMLKIRYQELRTLNRYTLCVMRVLRFSTFNY